MKRMERQCIDELGEVILLMQHDDIARAKMAFKHMDDYYVEYTDDLSEALRDLLYDVDHYLSNLSKEKLEHIVKRFTELKDSYGF